MKVAIVAALGVLLGACNMRSDPAQIAELQKQVASLSKQVHALNARAGAGDSLELQRKCSVDAERAFNALGYSAANPTNGITAAFFSHYNPALQRCFTVLSTFSTQGLETIFLSDANENMLYGTFMEQGGKVLQCEMTPTPETQLCTTKQQWDQYVARYMGNVPR